MKRILLSFALLFGSILANASHLDGGQLYWTALGNNQYVIQLQLIRKFDGAGLPSTANITSNIPNLPNINLFLTRLDSIAPECFINGSGYQIHSYESSPVTISTPTAGTPWEFTYSLCCLPSSNAINIDSTDDKALYIRSRMYVYGNNKSSPYIELRNLFHQRNSRNILIPAISKNGRPVDLRLVPMFDQSGTPYNYKPGFSHNKPTSPLDTLLPSGLFVSGNVNTTGLAYLSFFAEERTIDGHLIARSNFTFGYSFRTPNPNEDDPDITISSNTTQYSVQDNSIIKIKSGMGHNISLQFDASVIAGSQSASTPIVARLYTDALSHLNIPDPTLTNVSTGGLQAAGSISTEFNYTIPSGFPEGITRFVITFEDGNCPLNGLTTRIVEIENSGKHFLEYAICEGDSAQFTTPVSGQNFSWFPTIGVSNPTDSVTYIKPNSSTEYGLIVDGDTVAKYQIHVSKNIKPSIRLNSFAQIELMNSNDYNQSQLLWFYMPVEGEKNKTTYSTTDDGLYHIRVGPPECPVLSDSIEFLPGNTRYLSIYDKEVDQSLTSHLASRSYSFMFRVSFGSGQAPTQIRKIIIPKVSVGTGASAIELTYRNDNTGQSFKSNGTLLPNGNLEFNLVAAIEAFNTTYTFTILPRTGSMSFLMALHGGLPFNTLHMEVKAAVFDNVSGPRYDLLPQVIFAGTGGIGIEENETSLEIYPTPADDFIIVKGIEPFSAYSLYSMDGRIIEEGTINENASLSTSQLSDGFYILKIENQLGSIIQKLIVNHR